MFRRVLYLLYCSTVTLLKFLKISSLKLSFKWTPMGQWSVHMSQVDTHNMCVCWSLHPICIYYLQCSMSTEFQWAYNAWEFSKTQMKYKVNKLHVWLSKWGHWQPKESMPSIQTRACFECKKKKRVIALINVNEQGTPSYFSYSCYFPILTNH